MKTKIPVIAVFAIGLGLGSISTILVPNALNGHSANQPYADEQGRRISSLSAKDVADLKDGKGWGLAKPAEFNDYPGPSHVLEFAEKLALNDVQKTAVNDAFVRMQSKAKGLGLALINAEKALDAAFVSKAITKQELDRLLSVAENARAQLRSVHLSAHLEVTPLLTTEQKLKYASLRGYGNGHGGH